MRNVLIGTAFLAGIVALGVGQNRLEQRAAAQAKASASAPRFEVDPFWPKPLPNHWILGSTIGVSVDFQDHVWIIHRGAATLDPKELWGTGNPPASDCCAAAPPVLEFDQAGNLLNHWGGPGQGYEWPESNHGITVDSKGIVWIGGNGASDGHILKFTRDGKFVKQFGFQYASAGSNDMWAFGRVAKIFLDEKSNEAYIADGYGNKRVAVIDMDSGKIKRYWGAYGNKPSDANLGPYNPAAPPAQQFRNPVHCAELSNDGFVYACDRANDRVQVFRKDGTFVKEVFVQKNTARRRLGVGHRLLEGCAAEVLLPGRRRQRQDPRVRPRIAHRAHGVRRRRAPARPVLRGPQHRGRLEGQPLHDGNLRGQARAAVPEQRGRAGDDGQPGHALAEATK